jgi:Protein of unknown function (DUF3352)
MSRLRARIATLALVLAALLLAGCGGTEKSGVSDDSGAKLIRPGALAYAAIDSDLGSSQWQQVDALLKKFPGRDEWLASLKRSLAEKNLDYDRDVKDALGPEVDIAVVSAGSPQRPAIALLTKPDSMDKARALVRELDQSPRQPATRVVDGWLAVSKTNEMLDRVLKGSETTSLADDAAFKDAFAELPTDALAKAYVNGRQLADLADALLNGGAQPTAAGDGLSPFGLDKLDWISASLQAKDNGLDFEGDVKGASGSRLVEGGASYASKLITGVPSDALAFGTFRGGAFAVQLSELRKNPMFDQGLRQAEKALGMRLDEVLSLLTQEVAFYVRRGPGLPEFSLVLEEPDEQQAFATLQRLFARIDRVTPAQPCHAPSEAGVTVGCVDFGRFTIRYAAFDGKVLVTTAPTGISDYRATGDKLADDQAFKDALDAAGAPDKTGSLVYVNVHDGVQLIESYMGISGEEMPPKVRENLKPLKSFVAYSVTKGDLTRLTAFLEIE